MLLKPGHIARAVPVRFNPVPLAFREIRKTGISGFSLKSHTSLVRYSFRVAPVIP